MQTHTSEIDVKNWAEFQEQLRALETRRKSWEGENGRLLNEPLFRGLGNVQWGLETTLERSFPGERSDNTLSFIAYYRKMTTALPAIESLGGQRWSDVPSFPDFKNLLKAHNRDWLDWFFSRQLGIYRLMIYLRHHGFPSPLLDWTASPYVAALFAFDMMDKGAEHVCVYSFLRDNNCVCSSSQHFFVLGPYIQTDRRHFLQQSQYSMCVGVDSDDYIFQAQEAAMKYGILHKIRIPASERTAILKELDRMNINPYSLFGSEESLIRSVARRECLFKGWSF